MGYILSLDCGSTNFKAALFDENLQRLSEDRLPVASLSHGIQRVELDGEQVWQQTVALLQRTCQAGKIKTTQVTRLSITSQAQTFLLLDEKQRPLTPLISWLDRRAEGLLPQVWEALGADFGRHCSFASPMAQMQLPLLLWLRQQSPELLERACLIAPLPTWLSLRLGAPACIDDNLAAMSGLYSLQTGAYWQAALDLCGVKEGQLPKLVEAGTLVPLHPGRSGLALAPQAAIVLAGNDQTCNAFGNDCQMDAWVAALGTALVAYRLAGKHAGPYHPDGCWGPYPAGGYYELAVQAYGCAALDWAHGRLYPGQELAAFFDAARSASGRERVFFFPERMGTPAAWTGEGQQEAKALAVLEGIGFTLKSLLFGNLFLGNLFPRSLLFGRELSRSSLPWGLLDDNLGTGEELHRLIVTGGGSRSDLWLSLLADLLGIPIQRGRGDGLLGAARLALPGVQVSWREPATTWDPQPDRAAFYQDLYNDWLVSRTGENHEML